MVKIMILEDNTDSLAALATMVKQVSEQIEVTAVSDITHAREALQKSTKQEEEPFAAFLLDINLETKNQEDTSGITFAQEIRAIRQYAFAPLIMVTSLAQLELTAYRQLHCYQYLVKPYDEKQITELIRRLLVGFGHACEPTVVVKKDGINYKLYCKDILYIKAVPRGICMVMPKEEMKIPYLSLRQILEKLPAEQFLQCHRMYVVNLAAITYVDLVNGIISLREDRTVEIGVTYKNQVRRCLNG